jgi:1-acyl-sn-glycerol-3-phosphate acyltransferase
MIRTILSFLYVLVTMTFLIPFGIIIILLYFIGLKKLTRRVLCFIEQVWGLTAIKVSGCKITVAGRENIPKKGGVCFVSNHCGYFDIVLLLAYCGRSIGFIAKKELIFVPFINIWIFLVGGFFIDRSSPKKAIRTIEKGVKRIKSGDCIIIFPEGHRSKGRGLLPFHAGSLKLATMAEAPVVPVAIEGSYDVIERTLRVVSAPVKITFCEPIDTAALSPDEKKQALSDRIYSIIKEKLET